MASATPAAVIFTVKMKQIDNSNNACTSDLLLIPAVRDNHVTPPICDTLLSVGNDNLALHCQPIIPATKEQKKNKQQIIIEEDEGGRCS